VLVVYAVGLVLLVYALMDLARTPASAVRSLPKPVWFVVVLAPVLGPLLWLAAGRPSGGPRRRPPAAPLGGPDDDEDFLRGLRRDADDRRRRARDPRDDES
jgi:hypothetical protein